MKRLNQINASKQMILDGFMQLLAIHEYDDITMSEIAKASGVVRMTLYRHFKSKEDILLYVFQGSFQKTLDYIQSLDQVSLLDLMIFRYQLLKASPYTSILARHEMLDHMFHAMGKAFAHHFEGILPSVDDPHKYTFMVGGIDALTADWINNGMIEEPEFIAKKSVELLRLF